MTNNHDVTKSTWLALSFSLSMSTLTSFPRHLCVVVLRSECQNMLLPVKTIQWPLKDVWFVLSPPMLSVSLNSVLLLQKLKQRALCRATRTCLDLYRLLRKELRLVVSNSNFVCHLIQLTSEKLDIKKLDIRTDWSDK